MKILLLTSLVVIVYIFEVNGRVYAPKRRQRPGTCPDPLTCYPITRYHKRCHDDYDCDKNHKCCSDIGGHHICQKVRNIRRYSGCPSVKDVSCIIENGVPDRRHDDCRRHSDCGRNYRCCSDEFGHRICVRRASKASKKGKVKPGQCRPPRRGAVSCREECNNDVDCRGPKKCCYNGCARVCQMPVRHLYAG